MKVLMSAYACEPGRGSEPGAGWAWARAAAQNHEVWVLTHETNRASVTAALAEDPELAARLHPVFLRGPRWARPLRRRGPSRYLYYWIWQLGPCPRAARQLHAAIEFDVTHHLTYASDWMPAGVSALPDVPFVWGPVGGSSTQKNPRLWWRLGAAMFAAELFRAALLAPLRRIVGGRLARRAAVTLGQNHDVAAAFAPVPVVVEPNVALPGSSSAPRFDSGSTPVAVYAGRLLALKGLALGVEALTRAEASTWRLDVYGDGPKRGQLERLAARLGVADRVRFLGARPRDEVLDAFSRADALLFPSTRDAAGWSVAEAMAAGCPVVCLRAGGPAALVTSTDGVLVDPCGDVVGDIACALSAAQDIVPDPDRWSVTRLPTLLERVYASVTRDRATSRAA
jgi:glycosyltransferase involved in cell wall biosynthesis